MLKQPDNQKQTRFDLDQCFSGGFTPGHAAFDDESKPHRYAIKSQLEREHRVLPDSLAALWKSGKISAEQLPALLKGLEPDLKRSDYIRLLTMNPRQRSIRTWGTPFYGALMLALGSSLLSNDGGTGAVMIAIGVLAIVVPLVIVRSLKARRRQQSEWAIGYFSEAGRRAKQQAAG